MRTLLTGFGPFETVISNPTGRLAACFTERSVAGHELDTLLLPVSYERAPLMLAEVFAASESSSRPYDLVLMLGVATGALHWRVERYGRNRDELRPDIDGFTPQARPIVPDAPDLLPVTLPVDALVAALQNAGLPAVASDSAGGYLCNHLLFHALHLRARTRRAALTGFLHVPADEATFASDWPGKAASTFDQQISAVQVVLKTLAGERA